MIRINNRDELEWEEGLTVAALLEQLNYTFPHIIVTIDGEVIQQPDYPTRLIPDGANVRLVHLIAGG